MCVTVRVNDSQLVMISEKAHYDHSLSGYLYKRTADSTKWQQRWFILYQVSELFVDVLSTFTVDCAAIDCIDRARCARFLYQGKAIQFVRTNLRLSLDSLESESEFQRV